MALKAGKNATIKLADELLARMISFNLTFNNETIDAIYFGSDWVKAIGGIQGATASVSGFLDTDSTSQITFRQAAEDHTMLTTLRLYVDATHYYAPDTVSDTEAGVWIESFNITADNGSIVSFDASLKYNGPII